MFKFINLFIKNENPDVNNEKCKKWKLFWKNLPQFSQVLQKKILHSINFITLPASANFFGKVEISSLNYPQNYWKILKSWWKLKSAMIRIISSLLLFSQSVRTFPLENSYGSHGIFILQFSFKLKSTFGYVPFWKWLLKRVHKSWKNLNRILEFQAQFLPNALFLFLWYLMQSFKSEQFACFLSLTFVMK